MTAFYSRQVQLHLTSAQKVTLRKLMYPFHKMQCCCSRAHNLPSFSQNSSQRWKNSSSVYCLLFLKIFLRYDCTWVWACAPVWWPDIFWSISLYSSLAPFTTVNAVLCFLWGCQRFAVPFPALIATEFQRLLLVERQTVYPPTVTTTWDISSTSAVWAHL